MQYCHSCTTGLCYGSGMFVRFLLRVVTPQHESTNLTCFIEFTSQYHSIVKEVRRSISAGLHSQAQCKKGVAADSENGDQRRNGDSQTTVDQLVPTWVLRAVYQQGNSVDYNISRPSGPAEYFSEFKVLRRSNDQQHVDISCLAALSSRPPSLPSLTSIFFFFLRKLWC